MENKNQTIKKNDYELMLDDFNTKMTETALEEGEEYRSFVSKFKRQKTSDECYTPPAIYEVVADYVERTYGIDKSRFIRPFYPGGNYKEENYESYTVVVDNPPFSILSEIIKYYEQKGILYFLFCDTRYAFNSKWANTHVIVGANIIYENGARVNTSFLTNLDSVKIKSAPDLYEALLNVTGSSGRILPKYKYPPQVITAMQMKDFSHYGIYFSIPKESCYFIRQLDAQKSIKKGIYGAGYLLSKTKTEERIAGDLIINNPAIEPIRSENTQRKIAGNNFTFELSERELDIIDTLK